MPINAIDYCVPDFQAYIFMNTYRILQHVILRALTRTLSMLNHAFCTQSKEASPQLLNDFPWECHLCVHRTTSCEYSAAAAIQRGWQRFERASTPGSRFGLVVSWGQLHRENPPRVRSKNGLTTENGSFSVEIARAEVGVGASSWGMTREQDPWCVVR